MLPQVKAVPTAFSGTLRSLQGEGKRRRWLAWAMVGLLIAWAAWMALARITVYEVATQARLEVNQSAHAVAAPVEGRVVRTSLAIGREVNEGDVLLVLDAQLLEREMEEHRVRRAALRDQIGALEQELLAGERRVELLAQARQYALQESKELLAKSQAEVRLYQSKVQRFRSLASQDAASLDELEEAEASLEGSRATVNSLTVGSQRIRLDREAEISTGLATTAQLRSRITQLQGEIAVEGAKVRLLEEAIALRTIRSPVGGRIGQVAEVRAGSVVRPAQQIATVVPTGEPRAVAQFPASAVGRLQPGQHARLRFDRFPWTQYGSLPAVVTDVGNEAQDGRIRVEFAVEPVPDSAIPLEHGLSGTAEVEIERASPLNLVLRAVGECLRSRQAPHR